MGDSPSDPQFWKDRYRRGSQGWEIWRPAPPLERWFDAHSPKGKRVLVVGCGRGHDARMLAKRGAKVTAVDFADEAIGQAIKLAESEGMRIDFRVRDLFDMAAGEERWDLVVEHTCFCAIEPKRRDEYVDVVADVLVDGGELVALLFCHDRPGGPPFGADADALVKQFSRRFSLVEMTTPEDSVEDRRGEERLAIFRRR